jgi:dienelactone hydrolase
MPPAWTPKELAPDFCGGTGPSRSPTSLLQTFASQYSDLTGWEARAKTVREGMQKKMRLYPWPEKTPLKAVIHSRKVNVALGISVENVSFESVPGFFVTGNLYRPLQCTGKLPGILRVHGHGTAPRFGGDFQRHCAAMASMGAVVFGYDMVGKGESTQVPHCFPEGVMAAQTWDTIRAVDFLLSLGADPERIGITGESGGGTQSYVGAAMDPRIALTMPGVIVGGTDAGIWMGGCNCEGTGMGINKDTDANNDITDYETDSVDIAALAAPHFQLILSDSKDPLAPNAPTTTMPYLKNVYRLYGAEGNVDNFVDNTGHNYHYNKRVASYEFLAAKFKMGPDLPDEGKYEVFSQAELRAFPPEHPRPDYALKTKEAVVAALLH